MLRRSLYVFILFCTGFLTGAYGQIEETDSSIYGPDTAVYIPGVSSLLTAEPAERFNAENLSIAVPDVIISGVKTPVTFSYSGTSHHLSDNNVNVFLNGREQLVTFEGGKAEVEYTFSGEDQLVVETGDFVQATDVNPIPLWLSIVPPLLAILMALVFREVLTALFTGIFVGGAILYVYADGLIGIPKGLLAVLDTYIVKAVADTDHVSVILFSMLIGAIVAVISRNGGMKGVVDRVARYARNARSGQFATWFLGIAIFFDDYANTLVVGNTMRPVTDRLRISREKLSYLVDSTAAPISAIAFITTWIGAELGYIQDGIDQIAHAGATLPGDPSPYSIFLGSLQYSFYPILTLAFMLFLIWKRRDFGPMYKAEMRARQTGQVKNPSQEEAPDREKAQELDDLEPVRGATANPWNAILPIGMVIFGTMVGLWYTGMDSLREGWAGDPAAEAAFYAQGAFGKLSDIVGSSNSYAALLWSSLLGLLTAVALTLGQRIMNLTQTIDSVLGGFKTMMHAMIILILAWSLAKVTDDLHTADFMTQLLGDGISPFLIPAITFLLAAAVSFSTGSSWGTMAILYPLIIPACWLVAAADGVPPDVAMPILYNTVACVLAGSVLGDHCSPISDTTILSSLATSCNHIDHVRTQLPYALTVGTVAILAGTIPGAYGVPFWVTVPISLGILYGVIVIFGKPIPEYDAQGEA